ncbi:MAG: hypothetical protein HKN71_02800, partial [Gemmatimonadetes bacterium]|nr:hypothetical protein [Gemmatimonadota bacterium]
APDGALLVERTLAIAPSDIEVEVAIELAVPPGTPVVVELALTNGDRDVYRGGPVAVLPAEVPVPIPVSYVGELACEETVGEAVLGGLDAPPGVVDGRLEVGDCYIDADDAFADRWSLELPRDLGLSIDVGSQSGPALRLRVERLDGTVVAGSQSAALRVPLSAGSYVAVVTTVDALAIADYQLRASEYDRCDEASGALAVDGAVTGSLDALDCRLGDGTSADLWEIDVPSDVPYRLDLESVAFDARLILTDDGATDPLGSEALDEDDDGGVDTNALLAGVLEPGRYRVWVTSFEAVGRGDYQLSLKRLTPGPPNVEVRAVRALGVGGLDGVCGFAQPFLFEFGFEDGDGDLVAPGGVSLRLTGIPSGFQELRVRPWDAFSGIRPYAGFTQFVACETFLSGDSGKLAEFFITDAAGGSSTIFSTTLTPVTGSGVPRDPQPSGGLSR